MSIYIPDSKIIGSGLLKTVGKSSSGNARWSTINTTYISSTTTVSTMYCSHFTFPERCIVKHFGIQNEAAPAGSDRRLRFAVYEADQTTGLPTTRILNSLNTISIGTGDSFGSYVYALPTSGQFIIDKPKRVIVGLCIPLSGFSGGAHQASHQAYPGYANAQANDYELTITGFTFDNFLTTITSAVTGAVTRRNSTAAGSLRLCNADFFFGIETF